MMPAQAGGLLLPEPGNPACADPDRFDTPAQRIQTHAYPACSHLRDFCRNPCRNPHHGLCRDCGPATPGSTMPARVRAASWPAWTSRPMKALMRWVGLLGGGLGGRDE